MRRSTRLASKANYVHDATLHAPGTSPRALRSQTPRTAQPRKKQSKPPKPAKKSGIDGDALMLIVKSIPDKMERWQAAAAFALAGAFGSGWKEFLAPFWLTEAQQLFPDNSFLQGPFRTTQSKKRAAKIAKMDLDNLPQTVAPELVAVARHILLERQVEREIEALQVPTTGRGSRIAQTRALSEYHLNHHDIAHLDYTSRSNPYHPSWNPMKLFNLKDIIRTAYLKYGGAAGLEEENKKSDLRKEHFRQTKDQRDQRRREKMEQRREELRAALAARGAELRDDSEVCFDYIHKRSRLPLQYVVDEEAERQQRENELVAALGERGLCLRSDSSLCDQYIEGESYKSLAEIVDIMHEMDFYFKYTRYPLIKDRMYEWWRTFGPRYEEMPYFSEDAKVEALSELKGRIGVEKILSIPNLPPTIRARLEREKKK
jgi:hypothetical protein